MAEAPALKDYIDRDAVKRLGRAIKDVYAAFPLQRFERQATRGLEPLSFTGRPMGGMVEIDTGEFADEDLRAKLTELSLTNAASLPPKG